MKTQMFVVNRDGVALKMTVLVLKDTKEKSVQMKKKAFVNGQQRELIQHVMDPMVHVELEIIE